MVLLLRLYPAFVQPSIKNFIPLVANTIALQAPPNARAPNSPYRYDIFPFVTERVKRRQISVHRPGRHTSEDPLLPGLHAQRRKQIVTTSTSRIHPQIGHWTPLLLPTRISHDPKGIVGGHEAHSDQLRFPGGILGSHRHSLRREGPHRYRKDGLRYFEVIHR